jgi:hypothetical protein
VAALVVSAVTSIVMLVGLARACRASAVALEHHVELPVATVASAGCH